LHKRSDIVRYELLPAIHSFGSRLVVENP
jgi:hypothetical protein